MIAELESIYQKAPTPKPGFWPTWDTEEPLLVKKLQARPLGLADIENWFSSFRSKLLRAL